MNEGYVLSIDQSTQGTKALLFNNMGNLLCREDISHKQIISDLGWVSHNLNEIYNNTISVVKKLVENNNIDKNKIVALGISNQRETSAAWNKNTGEPINDAIVWQCSRAKEICNEIEKKGYGKMVKEITGINLSPYFPASKFSWLLENINNETISKKDVLLGTIDSWLVYKLTEGKVFKTDYSNASRTQLLNLENLEWDKKICEIFGINRDNLADICDSNSIFGYTSFEGYLDKEIPICGVIGDSHGALFGQGCLQKGMAKVTYGTGSSVMMNVGEKPVYSENGVVTSLAWGIDGKVNYVLEGNINYTGAVISWLEKELGLVNSAQETEKLAYKANYDDTTYLIPAFTGLGAPYWSSDAKAMIYGMTRNTGKAEIARAALECIGYQIADALEIMIKDSKIDLKELRVDGGPTRNKYLMQFQSDMTNIAIQIPDTEELSGIGAAYLAGLKIGIFDETVFDVIKREKYIPQMTEEEREKKHKGWNEAIDMVIGKEK